MLLFVCSNTIIKYYNNEKIKFNEKLNLNKLIVSELNSAELKGITSGKDDIATRTGTDVCTALPAFRCCDPVSTHPACTK